MGWLSIGFLWWLIYHRLTWCYELVCLDSRIQPHADASALWHFVSALLLRTWKIWTPSDREEFETRLWTLLSSNSGGSFKHEKNCVMNLSCRTNPTLKLYYNSGRVSNSPPNSPQMRHHPEFLSKCPFLGTAHLRRMDKKWLQNRDFFIRASLGWFSLVPEWTRRLLQVVPWLCKSQQRTKQDVFQLSFCHFSCVAVRCTCNNVSLMLSFHGICSVMDTRVPLRVKLHALHLALCFPFALMKWHIDVKFEVETR